MRNHRKSAVPTAYPNLSLWVAEFGTVEMGHRSQTRSFIRILDECGMIWNGRRRYRTLDDALAPQR